MFELDQPACRDLNGLSAAGHQAAPTVGVFFLLALAGLGMEPHRAGLQPGGGPPSLEFRNLTFTITSRAHCWSSATESTLLKGISGSCPAGRLTALAGPSGSGKTTLLDVLAGACYGGQASGEINVNGNPKDEWCRTNAASYVMQQDVLPYLDTPREAITTSALLRLPRGMPRERKLARVEQLLEVLDLQSCADLVIGDSALGVRGISGGQRRRTTIGIELVKDPALIFLDEPLSGLDSEMGEQVAECLARLARTGKTVVLSIHQPSSQMLEHLDHLLLLSYGSLVFCGPFKEGPAFLESLGHKQLPGRSPAEFMLTVLKDRDAAAEAAAAFAQLQLALPADLKGVGEHADDLEANGQGEGNAVGVHDRGHAALLHKGSSLVDIYRPGSWQQAPVWEQGWALLCRNARWMYRAKGQTLPLLLVSLFTGLMFGAIFWDMDSGLVTGSFTRSSVAWLTLTALITFYTNLGVAGWLADRTLVRREYMTRLYGITPLYLAKCATWAAFIPLLAFLYSFQYFMQGWQANAQKYFIYLGVMCLHGYCSLLLGWCVVFLLHDGPTSSAAQAAVGGLLIASNGFLSRDPPVYLRWVQESSFMTYAYSALLLNEFDGLTLYDDSTGQPVHLKGVPPGSPVQHASWGLGGNVAMLAGICGALSLAAFLLLLTAARLKRL